MTREEAKAWAPLYLAYAEGKLDVRVGGHWEPVPPHGGITWCNPPSDYRVRPEPREIWVFPNGTWLDAAWQHRCRPPEAIVFREVIP
jgi:hypothetical protein